MVFIWRGLARLLPIVDTEMKIRNRFWYAEKRQGDKMITHSDSRGPMRRIAVSLLKGGVAKSVTAVSLAHGMAMRGAKVLLVDTDVQAQCSDMLGSHPEMGLAQVIAGWKDPESALAKVRDNLWLLAGGNDLAGVKMEIARREMSPESVLDEALRQYDNMFDVMVMDTAPGWDTLLVNALFCCREVLSPVSMEPVALSGLIRFQERLSIVQKHNPQLALRWIIPTFVDGRVKKSAEILKQLHKRYGSMVGPMVKYSVKLSEAPAFGKTIFEHDPKGPGAKGYWAVTDRVLADHPVYPSVARRLRVAAPQVPVPAQEVIVQPSKVAVGQDSHAPAPEAREQPPVTSPLAATASADKPTRPPAASPPPPEVKPRPSRPVLKQRLDRLPEAAAPASPPLAVTPPAKPKPSYASLKERLGQVPPGEEIAEAKTKKKSPYLSLKERLKRGPQSEA